MNIFLFKIFTIDIIIRLNEKNITTQCKILLMPKIAYEIYFIEIYKTTMFEFYLILINKILLMRKPVTHFKIIPKKNNACFFKTISIL